MEYSNRARTERLVELLKKHKDDPAVVKKAEPAPEPPITEPEPTPDDPPEVKGESEIINSDAIRAKLKEFAAAKGTTAAKDLLADYNAENVSTLDEDHYANFMKAMEEALDD